MRRLHLLGEDDVDIATLRRPMRPSRGVLALTLSVSLASSACGEATRPAASPGLSDPPVPGVVFFRDGAITDEALARVVVDGVVDTALVDDFQAAFLLLAPPEQTAALQDLSARYELESAGVSGLVDAISDEGAATRAIAGAWVPVAEAVAALDPSSLQLEDATRPTGSRVDQQVARRPGTGVRLAAYSPGDRPPGAATLAAADSAPSAADVGAVGVLLAAMALGLVAEPVVSSANDIASADTYREGRLGVDTLVTGAVEQSSLEMDYNGQQSGVDVKFHVELVAHPCPDPAGIFDVSATVDIATVKGPTGANTKIEMVIRGQVDDDARLAGTQTETRMQTAAFGGGQRGQFLDFTIASGSSRETTYTLNRTGGAVTDELTSMGTMLANLFQMLMADKLVGAAEKAWSSGRCVRMEPTASPGPKGVEPGSTSTISAPPRSRVDGAAVGGSVTADLTAGGVTVAPSATKVPADATFTYVAPDDAGKSGTVTLEARSKRGVGKATLDFTTAAAPTVTITGPVQYAFNGMTGTATIDLTMTPLPDGSYTGTARVRMTGVMKLMQTTCERATWTETIDLTAEVTSEANDQILVISTTGEAPSGASSPMECTTAGVTVQSQTPLLSSSLFGEARIRLADGDQAFVVTAAPGKVSGTVRVHLS